MRSWWLVAVALVAAFFLYISLAGRPAQPQAQDDFPTEEAPPST